MVQLHDDLCVNYEISRRGTCEEEWPPNQPSSVVNLALIHYQNMRTQQELIEITKRCKQGASHVDKLTASDSDVTKDIRKIFAPENDNKLPKRILIEGAPGIGKTVLAKEIAYQWAQGNILKECKLVFLLYLRDPKLHKAKSIDEILELFATEISHDLKQFVTESHGINVAFVFDGFDEYPAALQKESFVTDLIKGKSHGKTFLYSTIVVTSRPTATLFLHGVVDRRIEILGFPKEERDKYILLSFRDSFDKKQELEKYLKHHPIINSLCYIPLHLAILVYLFQQDSLPETLTEMNESFILNTIYRYLGKSKINRPDVVEKLEDLPKRIVNFIYKLSQLAFKGLQNNQLVFSISKLKSICPEVRTMPGAINGFGLLQAVQHYPKRGAGRTTSVNFLHFTMQEYLAALHVSRLPSEQQSSLMKKTFWNGHFSFMWMMYVGIVGVKSNTFASFIVPDIYSDKLKCLHLFQCYVEAKSDVKMPKAISSIFTDGKIILDGITLLPHHLSSLSFFMSASSMQQWKILKLNNCNLGYIGISSLLEHFIKNDANMSTLEYVDLRGNQSSPWDVYCAIIRNCCVNCLTLCVDEGMKEYVKEIADSLKINTTLHSLTLHDVESTSVLEEIHYFLVNSTVLKVLNASWMSNGAKITCGKLIKIKSSDTRKLTLNIYPFTSFKENINDIVRYLISGLYNIITQQLDISCNNITDTEALIISDSLKYNTVLKELDLSQNHINTRGMNKLSKSIKNSTLLEYVDLSGNNSSPWGVYSAIISRCQASSLTLCGDQEIKEYVKKIMESLQRNTTLHSLTLCSSKSSISRYKDMMVKANTVLPQGILVIDGKLIFRVVHDDWEESNSRVVNIKILYSGDCECSHEAINFPSKDIDDDTVCLLSFGLYNNTTIRKLDLSCNNISINGMDRLTECIIHAIPLEYVDLSGNMSSPWGVYCTIIRRCCVNSLTLCGDEGMKDYFKQILDNLQANTTLCSLALFASCRGNVRRNKKAIVRANNAKSSQGILVFDRKLCFSALAEDDEKGVLNSNNRVVNIKIQYSGDHACLPETFNLSNRNINDDTVYLLTFGLHTNTIVKQLDLSNNNISMSGMNRLLECVKHDIPLEYVDLSGNCSPPWGVYCAIIKHCCVNSLTLCGEKEINKYIKEIIHNLNANTTLQSLTLLSSGNNASGYKRDKIVKASDTKKSWTRLVVYGKLFLNKQLSDGGNLALSISNRVVDVKILHYDDCECLPGIISLSNKNVNDDIACLISLGLYNNTTVKKLDFSHNNIGINGMSRLSECIIHATPLEYVDLSENNSSPWGVYCAIIKHCCVNSLTLCGDQGMEEYVKEITNSLQTNTTLHSLTLCKIKKIGVKSLQCVLVNNTSLKELNLSWGYKGTIIIHRYLTHTQFGSTKLCSNSHKGVVNINILYDGNHECSSDAINMSNEYINDDAVYLITFGLHNNTTVQILNLSCNKITDDGAIAITECLKTNNTIQELNLSCNQITSKGAKQIAKVILVNKHLHKLNVSQNPIHDHGVMYISDGLKHNNTLLELNLSSTGITDKAVEAIAGAIQANVALRNLDLSQNYISDDGIIVINDCFRNNNTLRELHWL